MQNFNNVKVGDKLRVIAKTSGHTYPLGSEITVISIASVPGSNLLTCSGMAQNGQTISYNVYPVDVEFSVRTKEEIKKEIDKLKAEIEVYAIQLQYLEETKTDKFDALQFKAYTTLQLLKDNSKNDLEKSKILADLIRGK